MGQLLFGTLFSAVFFLYPLWRIFARAGLRPEAALLVLVPYAGPLIALVVLAFSRWPTVDRKST